MRYTIPGVDDWVRRVYLNEQTRAERWRILLTGDRLRGVGRNQARPTSVHRERVRFGAWEARPRGLRARVRVGGRWVDGPLYTIEWVHAPTGAPNTVEPVPVEGPACSGGSQTYKRGGLPVVGSVAWAEFGA